MSMLKCVICGMNVNEKNFNLNSYAFIDGNKKSYIRYCPFCGVNEIYLQEDGKVYSVDVNTLDSNTIKILDHAMKLEVFNGDFYVEASKLVKNENLKKEFLDLSRIEYMHANVHKRLGGFKELSELHKPDYTKYKKDEEFLEIAKKREEHAVAFYNKYSKVVYSEIVRKTLNALSEVEKEHIILIETK
ncbi:ferritin family protein [Clostridium ganghwense]|uniref:Ferritin family protein n=1 Tax=Clostridium ganghwense TaxID=312089 RepID=A0ABT4CP67_9CLOT|nr:ferritin family protein [Clostridium ganghwense]MCY6370850.1 ferritin family protein [Clostridium ganghwense]